MPITTPIIEQIHRHASIRKYKADPIDWSSMVGWNTVPGASPSPNGVNCAPY